MSAPPLPPPTPPPPLSLTVYLHPADSGPIAALHLIGVTILSYCIARGASSLRVWWAGVTWARFCVLVVLVDSWIFVFFSGLLVLGIGTATSYGACQAAIFACITFYALSKVFMYAFLVERVHIVWYSARSRLGSPAYQLSTIVFAGYGAIVLVMFVGKHAELDALDGQCVIGLPRDPTFVLVGYDLVLNGVLGAMFALPLRRFSAHKLRSAALRALVASTGSLLASCVNVVVLTIMDGSEQGYVCLASCIADVLLNALLLVWVTARRNDDSVSVVGSLDLRVLEEPPDSKLPPYRRGREFASVVSRPARTSAVYPPLRPSRTDEEGEKSVGSTRAITTM